MANDIEEVLNTEDVRISRDKFRLYLMGEINQASCHVLQVQLGKMGREAKVMQVMYGVTPPIELWVTSTGGTVDTALSVADTIQYMNGDGLTVNTVASGCTYSAATFLTVVGKKRYVTPNTTFLIHEVLAFLWYDHVSKLKESVENVEKIQELVTKLYLDHTKFSQEVLDELLKKDKLLLVPDILKYGLADEILTQK